MKSVRLKISIITFTCLSILLVTAGSASAHRVIVFAWVEGDTVYVESKFAGGKKVKGAKIIVQDSGGVELLAGRTNDLGEFSFKVPKPTDLNILIVAGQGHQGKWTIRAAELSDMPPKINSEGVKHSDQNKQLALDAMESGTAGPDTAVLPEELAAIIESVLDKKLKPITRMLADMQQKGPTAKDIFAGIGYIFGLVGIAAYVHGRKKKE